jgi:hypothetical protein
VRGVEAASVVCGTCGPPCEQLLTAVGTGAGSSIVGGGAWYHPILVPSLSFSSTSSSVVVVSTSPPLSLSSPPPCRCRCRLCHPPPCRLSSPIAILLPVVPIPVAPHSHHASSCSWRRLGVLSWWLSSWACCNHRGRVTAAPPVPGETGGVPPRKQLLTGVGVVS